MANSHISLFLPIPLTLCVILLFFSLDFASSPTITLPAAAAAHISGVGRASTPAAHHSSDGWRSSNPATTAINRNNSTARSWSLPESTMPHKTRPMTALLVFTGLNAVLCATITPVYDFVCFHPYWERRRERRRQEREAATANSLK